jgi:hypothetical protein
MLLVALFLVIDAILWNRLIKKSSSLAAKTVFVFNALQKVFLLMLCCSVIVSDSKSLPWGDTLLESPGNAAIGASAANWTIALLLLVIPLRPPALHRQQFNLDLFKNADRTFEIFLILAGFLNLFYWVAITDFSNPIYYIARRLDGALNMTPFFVGLTAFRLKLAFRFWLVVLACQIVISVITGTRGQAFIPLILFLAGFAIGLPSWKLRFQIGTTVLIPVAALLLFAGAYIGVARDIVGRKDLASALESGSLTSRVSANAIENTMSKAGDVVFNAFNRLTLWPPLVVPCMSPDIVPYWGFDDLYDEIAATRSIRIGSDQTSGSMYSAHVRLQPFGFAVHYRSDGLKVSSVELPPFVDGYARGGWISGFVFCGITYSVLLLLESIAARQIAPKNMTLFLMLQVVICSPTRLMDNGAIGATRLLVLEAIMCFVLFYIFITVAKSFGSNQPSTPELSV